MLKNILKLEGAQLLTNEQKKGINGGAICADINGYIKCLKFGGGIICRELYC
jgi:hypothetical protein